MTLVKMVLKGAWRIVAFAFRAILVTPRTVLGWMSAAAVMD